MKAVQWKGPTNFVFTNSGGNVVKFPNGSSTKSLSKNVFSKGSYIGITNLGLDSKPKVEYVKAFYTTVAKITYYVKTKSANIVEDNTNNGVLMHYFSVYPDGKKY